jgi:adenosylhomocysteine nucleosidase
MSPSSTSKVLPDANLRPCHVGIVYAMALEAASFEARLGGVISIQANGFTARQGGLNGRGIVVVHSGVGRKNAERATEALIFGHRPKWIISAGLAGGLHPGVKRGDIVMPDAILGEDGRRLAIDLQISAGERAANPDLHVGPLLTIDRVAFKAAEKRRLGQQHQAVAVDMETLGVAEACHREKQKFLAVRVVSDAATEELPADIERLVTRKTLVRRIGATAGTILRRPSIVKDLWRFRETAHTCSERLAKFLAGVVEQLAD